MNKKAKVILDAFAFCFLVRITDSQGSKSQYPATEVIM